MSFLRFWGTILERKIYHLYMKRLKKMVNKEPIDEYDGSNSLEDSFNNICNTTFKDLLSFDYNQILMKFANTETDYEE